MPYASTITPASLSWTGIGRELYAGTPVLPTAVLPVTGDAYEFADTPAFLADMGVRAAMASPWGEVEGIQMATWSLGGPVHLDVIGYLLDNLFGDLSTTITSGTVGTAQTLAVPLNTGDTTLYVNAPLGSVTTGSAVQITGPGPAVSEVVTVTTGSSGTVVNFTGTPCRFPHSSGTAALLTVPPATASYSHAFATLNSGSGQPPVHTLTDFTGLTPTVGARSYPAAVVTELELTGDATALLGWKASGISWLSAPSSAAPVAGTTFHPPLPNWLANITVGGSRVYDIGTWTVTFTRALAQYWGAATAQTPYAFPRGDLSIGGTGSFVVPTDETPLNYMLSSGLQSIVISLSNSLSGSNAQSITVRMSAAQFTTAKPDRGSDIIGYDDTFTATANITDTGGSGGAGAGTVTLVNNLASY